MPFSSGMFTWSPDSSSRGSIEFDVERVKLDSYEQNVAIGLNPLIRTWDLRFKRSSGKVKQILDFLVSKRGLGFFYTDSHTGLPVRVRLDGPATFSFTGSVNETLNLRLREVKGPQI